MQRDGDFDDEFQLEQALPSFKRSGFPALLHD